MPPERLGPTPKELSPFHIVAPQRVFGRERGHLNEHMSGEDIEIYYDFSRI